MSTVLWVAAGSALGGAGRYAVGVLLMPWAGPRLVWATLLVNVLGSFLIGYVTAQSGTSGRWVVSPDVRLFLTAGVLGGFTTFSAFSLQTIELIQSGHGLRALSYVAASVVLCLVGAGLGLWAGR